MYDRRGSFTDRAEIPAGQIGRLKERTDEAHPRTAGFQVLDEIIRCNAGRGEKPQVWKRAAHRLDITDPASRRRENFDKISTAAPGGFHFRRGVRTRDYRDIKLSGGGDYVRINDRRHQELCAGGNRLTSLVGGQDRTGSYDKAGTLRERGYQFQCPGRCQGELHHPKSSLHSGFHRVRRFGLLAGPNNGTDAFGLNRLYNRLSLTTFHPKILMKSSGSCLIGIIGPPDPGAERPHIIRTGAPMVFRHLRRFEFVELLPDDTIDGRSAFVFEGERSDGRVKTRFHLDKETGIMLKTVVEKESDKTTYGNTLSDIQLDTEFSEDYCIFIPPEGVEVEDLTYN